MKYRCRWRWEQRLRCKTTVCGLRIVGIVLIFGTFQQHAKKRRAACSRSMWHAPLHISGNLRLLLHTIGHRVCIAITICCCKTHCVGQQLHGCC